MKVRVDMKGVSNAESDKLTETINEAIKASQVYQDLVQEFTEELLKNKTLPTPKQYSEIYNDIHTISMVEDPIVKELIIAAVSKLKVFTEKDRELKDETSELN